MAASVRSQSVRAGTCAVTFGASISVACMLAAFDQGMIRDEPGKNARVDSVSPRCEVEIVPEEQGRGGRVLPEDIGRVHERDIVTRRKRLQLPEGPIVQ